MILANPLHLSLVPLPLPSVSSSFSLLVARSFVRSFVRSSVPAPGMSLDSDDAARTARLALLPPVSSELHGGHVFGEELFQLLDTFHLPVALINCEYTYLLLCSRRRETRSARHAQARAKVSAKHANRARARFARSPIAGGGWRSTENNNN
jgi:hypothetical protein